MNTNALILPKVLDIRSVASLHSELMAKLQSAHLDVDATAVERCDTAGAQLLVSLARVANSRLKWRLSDPLREHLKALGFDVNLFHGRTAPL